GCWPMSQQRRATCWTRRRSPTRSPKRRREKHPDLLIRNDFHVVNVYALTKTTYSIGFWVQTNVGRPIMSRRRSPFALAALFATIGLGAAIVAGTNITSFNISYDPSRALHKERS